MPDTGAGLLAAVKTVVTLGEAMLLLRATESGPLAIGAEMRTSVAGAELNVAIGLGRLGHTVTWIGRVGQDPGGRLVATALAGNGVDASRIVVDPQYPTGLLLRERRAGLLARVTYYRHGSAGSRLDTDDVLPTLEPPPDLLHLTGITPALGPGPRAAALAAAQQVSAGGGMVSLDVNHRSALCSAGQAALLVGELLPFVDLLFCGEDELAIACAAAGAAAPSPRALLDAGVREVIIKRGSRGAASYDHAGTYEVAATTVVPVDLVGAGDAFVAGYLSALLDGATSAGRLARAATLGAFCVAAHGDWEGLPTREELPLLELDPDTTLR